MLAVAVLGTVCIGYAKGRQPGSPGGGNLNKIVSQANAEHNRLEFIPNKGQWPEHVLARADLPGGQALATPEGMLTGLFDPSSLNAMGRYLEDYESAVSGGADAVGRLTKPTIIGHGWRIHFMGANPFSEQRIDTIGRSFDYYNYLNLPNGGSATEIHSYSEFFYRNVYRGVDVRYYAAPDGRGMENDIIIAPGADATKVSFRIDGIDNFSITEKGELQLQTSLGPVSITAPVSFTVDPAGRQTIVASHFRMNPDRSIGFDLGNYDHDQRLIIDPIVMRWATWVSNNGTGTLNAHNHGIDLDNAGNIYIGGFYGSAGLITVGAFQTVWAGSADALFAKYQEPASPGGTGVRLWQTYLGGPNQDNIYSIAIGPDNFMYAVGLVQSTLATTYGSGFTAPAYANRTAVNTSGSTTAFQSQIGIFKVNPLGTGALVRTLGCTTQGSITPYRLAIIPTPGTAFNIAIGGIGTLATGFTANGDIPTPQTPGGTTFTPTATTVTALGASISSDFATLNWIKQIGVNATTTTAYTLATDGGGNIYLAGGTNAATGFSFNSTVQTSLVGAQDPFIIKLSSAGTVTLARYINSSATNSSSIRAMNVAYDNQSLVAGGITGGMSSANILGTPYKSTMVAGDTDLFIIRMPLTLASTTWGTYLGGTGVESNMMGLTTDLNNDVYALGYTLSTNFPTAANPVQSTNFGGSDATFSKLSANGQTLLYSTYLGGATADSDPVGNDGIKFRNCRTYLAITAASPDFPLTANSVTNTKISANTFAEPVIVTLANPPDFTTTTVTPAAQTVACGGTAAAITAATPVYNIAAIARNGVTVTNGTANAYPSGVPTVGTYLWQRSVDYGTTWTTITPNVTGLTLSSAQIGTVLQDTRFRLIVNNDPCSRVASFTANVNTTSDIQAGPSGSCNGTNATFYANASGSGTLTYTWTLPAASGRANPGNVSSFTLSALAATDAGYYTVTVTGAGGCSTTRTLYFSATDCSFIPNSPVVPVAQNITTSPLNGASALPVPVASDPSGYPVASYNVNPPASGTLQYCTAGIPAGSPLACTNGGTLTQITALTSLTPSQAATLYYIPVAGSTTTSSFTYNATGPNGTSNTATVTIPLYNLPPVATSMTLTAVGVNSANNAVAPLQGSDPEGSVVTYNVTAPAAGQGTLSYCSNGAAAPACTGGTLTPIVGTASGLSAAQVAGIVFTPAASFSGLATFTYTTTDNGTLTSSTATVTIPVTAGALSPANNPPVTQSYTTEVVSNTSGTRPIPGLSATDANGTVASYTITTPPPASQGTLFYCTTGNFPCTGTLTAVPATGTTALTNAQAATLQFNPAVTFSGTATFAYSATDNINALSNISTVSIPVQNPLPTAMNINSNPVAINSTNTRISGPQATDNGSIASYTVTTAPNATSEGTLRYCSNGAVPPVCTGGALTAVTTGTVLTPAQAATLVFTPVPGYDGTVVIPYTAIDNNGAVSNAATITVPMTGGQYPVATDFTAAPINANSTAAQNLFTALNATVNAANTGGTITSYLIATVPAASQGVLRYCTAGTPAACTGGTLTTLTAPASLTPAQAASIQFVPSTTYEGPAAFTYTATDNRGNISNIANVNLSVINVTPVAQNVTAVATAAGGTAVTAPLIGTDPDGSVASYVINTIPPTVQGALTYCVTGALPGCTASALPAGTVLTPAQAATVVFTPAGTLNTTDVAFNYSVADNGGRVSNLATVEIPILPARPAEVVIAQNLAWTPANRAGNVPALIAATQSGIGIRSYLVNPPSSGTLQYCTAGAPTTCTGGTLTTISAATPLTPAQAATLYYTPVAGAANTPTFTYTATANDDGVSNTAVVSLPLYNLSPTANGYTTQAIATNSTASTPVPPLVALDPESGALTYAVTAPSIAQGTLKTCSNNTVPCSGTFTNLSGTTVLTAAQVAALSFTPASAFSGTATFTYTVTDNASLVSNVATINIPVTPGGITPANIPPITQNIVAEPMFQSAPQTLLPALSGADANGSVTAYTITAAPPAGQGTLYYCTTGNYPCSGTLTAVPVTGTTPLTTAQAATLQFQPNANYTGNAVFSYTATDSYTPAATSNVSTMTVPVQNPAPLAANIMTGPVLANSVDSRIAGPSASDNGSISAYTISALPSAAQGVLRYCTAGTPTACAGGTYNLVVAGALLTPAQAATLTFTPAAGFTGNVFVPYTATDNAGLISNAATINIPVYTINPPTAADFRNAPVNANSTTQLNLNTALAGTPNPVTNSAINTYTLSSIPPASQGTLTYCPAGTTGCNTPATAGLILTSAQKATLQFLPNGTFTGTAMIEYTATDLAGQVSNLANVQIPIINRVPEAASVTSTTVTAGGSAVTVPLTGADPDGTLTSYTFNTLPPAAQGTVTYCATGTLPGCAATSVTLGQTITPAQALTVSFTPAAAINTTNITFLYSVTDNTGAIGNLATATVPVLPSTPANAVIAQNITTAPTNIPRTVPALTATVQNGAAVTSYLVNPPASGTLQYCTAGTPTACTGGTLTTISSATTLTPSQAATLYYTPATTGAPVNGVFTYTATSGDITSPVATVTVPVYNVAPVAKSTVTGPARLNNATAEAIPALQAADIDGTVASYSVTAPGAAQGVLSYCSNGAAAPACTGGTLTPVSGTVSLTPAQAASLAFIPANGFQGNASFNFTATDNNGGVSNTATVTIPVTPFAFAPANVPPVTQSYQTEPFVNTAGTQPVPGLAGADADGTIAQYTLVTLPATTIGTLYRCSSGDIPCTGSLTAITAPGNLTLAEARSLQFAPAPSFAGGSYSFTYTATDNGGLVSNTSTVNVPIINPAPMSTNVMSRAVSANSTEAPVAAPAATDNGSVATYNVTAPATGTLRYCIAAPAACNTATLTTITGTAGLSAAQAASLVYTPVAGFSGNVSVPYTATDNNGAIGNAATITIPVVNIAPPRATDFNAVVINANSATARSLATALVGTANATTNAPISSYTVGTPPPASQGALQYCTAGGAVPACPGGSLATITAANTVLTAAQAASLMFVPNNTYAGPVTFAYTATDNLGLVSNIATVAIPVENLMPVAQNVLAAQTRPGGTVVTVPVLGVDPDGSVAGYVINTVPPAAQGSLTYCTTGGLPGCTAVALPAGTILTAAQAQTIQFTPSTAVRTGMVSFYYSVIDNGGLRSDMAIAQIPIAAATPLPVKLNDFHARSLNCAVVLDWETSNERGIDYYMVERSSDGTAWTELRKLIANGTANGTQKYQTTDEAPARGINYYRLRIVEKDATTAYTQTISSRSDCGAAGEIGISPNPFLETVQITGLEVGSAVRIWAADGKLVYNGTADAPVMTINAFDWASSTYMVRVEYNGRQVAAKQIVKTK
jgi:hypothetical protein